MPCQVVRLSAFARQLSALCKQYPLAEQALDNEISALGHNPGCGVAYPGFHPFQVRKHRLGLRAYRMGTSKGLRLIFLYHAEKNRVYPLVIYKKGQVRSEHEVKKMIVQQLQLLLEDLPKE